MSSQLGIGLLPLTQLTGALALIHVELADNFFQQFVLTVLGRKQFPQKARDFAADAAAGWILFSVGSHVNLAE